MISQLKISKRNLHGSSRFPFVLCHVENPKWTQTPASTMCIMTCSAAIQHFKKESLRRSERTKTTLSGMLSMLSAQLFLFFSFFFFFSSSSFFFSFLFFFFFFSCCSGVACSYWLQLHTLNVHLILEKRPPCLTTRKLQVLQLSP